MPDWNQLVDAHLRGRGFDDAIRCDVTAELAAHLEDIYENARFQAPNEEAATDFALQEVGDWHDLAAEIKRSKSKEGPVNKRTTTIWLPAVLSLLGASLLLMALERLGFQPREVRVGGFGMSLYWQWLISLPLFGALGAYLSQRAQGSIVARFAAALAPALVMLFLMSLILPWALAVRGFHSLPLVAVAIGVANWVAIPALALAIGAVPFLKESSLPRV